MLRKRREFSIILKKVPSRYAGKKIHVPLRFDKIKTKKLRKKEEKSKRKKRKKESKRIAVCRK